MASQGPLSMEFSRQEYWYGLLFPSPGDLPDLGIQPTSLSSPAVAGRFFTTSTISYVNELLFCHSVVSDSLQLHGLQLSRLPCPYHLPEFAQTHVHQVDDAINHLILCCPLLLLSSVFPSIRVFSNVSVLCIRWPKY